MYRSQHFRLQHVGGNDDDTFVPEIVPKVLLYPGSVLANYRIHRYVEFKFVNLLLPK